MGGTISNVADFKISAFVSYFKTYSDRWPFWNPNGPPNIVKFTANLVSASLIKMTFSK